VDALAALGNTDTTPPTVAITSPSAGATVSGTVTITATASDTSGIEKVRFWAGSTYLGYDASAPYAMPWDTDGLLNGPYRVRIQGFDTSANTTMEFIDVSLVNADTVPPVVTITNPANATGVSGTVNIAAAANDALGIEKVQFWAGSSYLGYDTKAPFNAAWDTTSVPDGGVFLRARAIDWAGNSTDAVIGAFVANADSTPPTVAILTPASGSIVSGLQSASALPTDDVAVQKVQFWIDGTYLGYEISAPWQKMVDTTGLSNGPHSLTIRAWDWNGNTSGYVSIGIVVSNGDDASPTVTIDSPSSSSTVSGVVNINATASDDGGVQKVQFWFGPVYLGYDASGPYSRTFDTTVLANGAYSIRVRAVDWSGNTSDYVADVTVSN
jgi:hypothetical protein